MSDDDVRAALACASLVLDRWRLQGVPLPPWLVHHHQRMRTLAICGKENSSGTAHLGYEHALDTLEAAEILSMSTRWVRLHAPELGGRKVGRGWMFDRRAIAEHLEGGRDGDNRCTGAIRKRRTRTHSVHDA
jgi:hypothetical protein